MKTALRFLNRQGIKVLGLSLKIQDDRVLDKLAEITLLHGIKYVSFYYKFDPEGYFDVPHGSDPRFIATYQFIKSPESPGKPITVVVRFDGRKIKTSKTRIKEEDATISIYFKNGRSIIKQLAGEDIFKLIMQGEFNINGNMSYLCKFGYLTNHMKV